MKMMSAIDYQRKDQRQEMFYFMCQSQDLISTEKGTTGLKI